MTTRSIIEQILDMARWAPSGDNTQPWRFEIINDDHVVVHGFDTRDHCVYDLDGHPSQLSIGALLETMAIAASGHQLQTTCERRLDMPETKPTFDVHFARDLASKPDPLIASILVRSVQRRRMRTRPLTAQEKLNLEISVGESYRILWLEGFSTKLKAAKLMFNNAKLRLTMPEAYRVHRDIIQWNSRFSEDRVPDQALGVDPATTRMMRFVMHSWKRVEFFNTYLAGTLAPRVQMDFVPSLACAAHFVIHAREEPVTTDDYIAAGRALQRFWLTSTHLGLVMQPEMTPLIFSRYVRNGIKFSDTQGINEQALALMDQFHALVGETQSVHGVFAGRIGAGPASIARSVRLGLEKLKIAQAPPH